MVTPSLRRLSDSTNSFEEVEFVGEWACSLMNVENVNSAAEVWEESDVETYRLTSTVDVGDEPTHIWPRGRRSSGWRLIDETLDGNPTGPPHYDGLYYGNWARVASQNGSVVTFECYTYRVTGLDVWSPFDPYEPEPGYWLHYSYVRPCVRTCPAPWRTSRNREVWT